MKISFTPSYKDQYLAAMTLHLKTPALLLISLIFSGCGLLLIYLTFFTAYKKPSLLNFMVIILTLGAIPIMTAINVYLTRRKNKTIDVTQYYTFQDNVLKISGPDYTTEMKWSALHKIKETKRFFFFYISPRMAYYLPKSALATPSQLDEIRSFLKEHVKSGLK